MGRITSAWDITPRLCSPVDLLIEYEAWSFASATRAYGFESTLCDRPDNVPIINQRRAGTVRTSTRIYIYISIGSMLAPFHTKTVTRRYDSAQENRTTFFAECSRYWTVDQAVASTLTLSLPYLAQSTYSSQEWNTLFAIPSRLNVQPLTSPFCLQVSVRRMGTALQTIMEAEWYSFNHNSQKIEWRHERYYGVGWEPAGVLHYPWVATVVDAGSIGPVFLYNRFRSAQRPSKCTINPKFQLYTASVLINILPKVTSCPCGRLPSPAPKRTRRARVQSVPSLAR